MGDEKLYRTYRRMFMQPRTNRGISVRGFLAILFFAAISLCIAIYFDNRSGLPGWIVPAGILTGSIGTIAFQRWNLALPRIRSREWRSTILVALYSIVALGWHFIGPPHTDGLDALISLNVSCLLGSLLTFWAQIFDPIDQKEPEQPSVANAT